ncbi:MAG: hypothetical protein SFT90_00085 [Rickettsiales bacterium]|nr:hypothetical protein [Rickettsiales bacterium]
MKEINLHIGAHKTATTFIQETLEKNISLLENKNIFYCSRLKYTKKLNWNILRRIEGVTGNLQKLDSTQLRKELKSFENEYLLKNKIIISDEEISGSLNLKVTKYLYNDVGKYLNFINTELKNYKIKIFFCIRNYASFIESAYLQLVKMGVSYSFKSFISKEVLENLSWLSILQNILDSSKNVELVVWDYESFSSDDNFKKKIISKIAFNIDPKSFYLIQDKKINPSYSEEALKIAIAANSILSKKEDKNKVRAFLTKNFSTKQGYNKPSLFSNQEYDLLSLRYKQDIEQIKSMKNIIYLQPSNNIFPFFN